MQDDWDFYLSRVNDSPASVFVNLALRHADPPPETTLYAVEIEMQHPGPHGMGGAEEAEALGPIEDSIVRAGSQAGFRHIGRVRSGGIWRICTMGTSGRREQLESIVKAQLDEDPRSFTIVEKPDEKWSFYHEFLYPDPDRLQWIQNRRVVESLERRGDPLTSERRVDHFVYFPNEAARTAFADEVRSLGFTTAPADVPGENGQYTLSLHRLDPVELSHIHAVTMQLSELAQRHGGDYDSWKTSVQPKQS